MVFSSKTFLSALPHPDTLLYLTHLPCDKHKLPQGHGVGQKGPAHPHFHPARKMNQLKQLNSNTNNYQTCYFLNDVANIASSARLDESTSVKTFQMLSIASTIDNINNQKLQFN